MQFSDTLHFDTATHSPDDLAFHCPCGWYNWITLAARLSIDFLRQVTFSRRGSMISLAVFELVVLQSAPPPDTMLGLANDDSSLNGRIFIL